MVSCYSRKLQSQLNSVKIKRIFCYVLLVVTDELEMIISWVEAKKYDNNKINLKGWWFEVKLYLKEKKKTTHLVSFRSTPGSSLQKKPRHFKRGLNLKESKRVKLSQQDGVRCWPVTSVRSVFGKYWSSSSFARKRSTAIFYKSDGTSKFNNGFILIMALWN